MPAGILYLVMQITSSLRYHILTWGCQMNDAESAAMARLLDSQGHRRVGDPWQADLILLVTCCVREKPEQKVYSLLGTLREWKRERPGAVLAVAGCMAQQEGARLRRRMPHVDLVLGPKQLYRLPALLAARNGAPHTELDLARGHAFCAPAAAWQAGEAPGLSERVTIIQGCTNFCSYCVVPHVRGPETSRPAEEVMAEVRAMVGRGTREITLLGQNVLAYGREGGDTDFVGLLARLHEIPGLWRIRFTTCHPRDVDERLIAVLRDLPLVCPHLHLPIQHGDDEVLRRMNRPYTVAEYERKLVALRQAAPGIAVTTDLLVGFPGETEAQFQALLGTTARLRFEGAFMFAFSPRRGTPAATLPDQVPAAEKRRRLRTLIALQNRITSELHRARVGEVHEVLVTGKSESDPARQAGRTRTFHQVVFPCDQDLAGTLVKVRLVRARLWGFEGELVP